MNNQNVAVCVTVLNRYDLLRELLVSLLLSGQHVRVIIIDNGNEEECLGDAIKEINLPITVYVSSPALGLAASWNWFIDQTKGEERIICNDDIKFAPESIGKLLESEADLVFPEGVGFSCFLIRDKCIQKIGLFDEHLSPGFAYFEDCDYMFRKDQYNESNASDPVVCQDVANTSIYHHRGATQKCIPSEEVRSFRGKYFVAQENFIAKWGKLPSGLRRMSGWECGKGHAIIVGDSPTVSTGFSHCTRTLANELISTGWSVSVLGFSYWGEPHNFPYSIYPCYNPLEHGFNSMGDDRLPALIDRLKPDVVVLLNDPWNVKLYFDQIDAYNASRTDQGYGPLIIPPIIGWLAVDSLNQKGYECNRLSHLCVWTDFAADEMAVGGHDGSISVVPLGVDLDIFQPKDRAESRKIICSMPEDVPAIPEDAFVVGVVGRNQLRKRLDLTIAYFSEWIKRYNIPDAYLYLYSSPTGERSCDINQLVEYHLVRHGIKHRVIVPEVGRIGIGNDVSLMPYFYSAFDVLLSTSQAEGWYLPGLEAMACRCPVLVPDFAALGERGWTGDAAIRIPCTSSALTAPMNAGPYTIGGIPDKEETISRLDQLYHSPTLRKCISRRGLALASGLTWKRSGEMMRGVIESVLTRPG